jgi:hypothetical protein
MFLAASISSAQTGAPVNSSVPTPADNGAQGFSRDGGLGTDLYLASATAFSAANANNTGPWTWVDGSSTTDSDWETPGVYGTLGKAEAGNIPPGRSYAVSWTDSKGNFWLFGGEGVGASGPEGNLNDLWEYNPSTNLWAWMCGSSSINRPGVYGSVGTASAGNTPGGRILASNWTDSSGNLWLYGGLGEDANGTYALLDDLWKFDPSTKKWAWMGGSETVPDGEGEAPVYGTQGTPSAGNNPGGRIAAMAWTDNEGMFWLYAGDGYFPGAVPASFNDLWKFDPSIHQWAWMSGSNQAGTDCPDGYCIQPAIYGTQGTPAAGNNPGSRDSGGTWTDGSGNLWLFGGALGTSAYYNDLWEYFRSTNEWAWIGGSSTADQAGTYGVLGTPAAGNIPGGRCCTATWADTGGNLWLFGGQGYDGAGQAGDLNDLWEFNPSTGEWAWIDGTSVESCGGLGCYEPGVYGTQGTPAVANIPGSRQNFVSWTDNNGNFWLFGGSGADAADNLGNLNDLWRYGIAGVRLPAAATPTFSVPAGSYFTAQSVQIADTTAGATIYYTADGTTPTTGSSVYSSAITVSTTETLKAIATASGFSTSAVAIATYTITKIPTSTELTVSANALTFGQSLTLIATVTPEIGATPAGTVTFLNGGAMLGSASLNGSGVATLTLTPGVGSYSIAASYGGSTTDRASTSSPAVQVTVSKISTATELVASSTSLFYGQPLLLTATVTPASGATPAGTVTFYDGANSLGRAALNGSGVATLTLTPAVGSYSITASYGGSANDLSSVSTPAIPITVSAAATTTMLIASPAPAYFGQKVTFTAKVSSSALTPAGSVSFYDGTALLATVTLQSGGANYSTGSLSVGVHDMTAVYAPAAGFTPSTSNVVVELIDAAVFTLAATPAARTLYTGEAATYSVTVTPGTGFGLAVALSCTQLPANTTCSFSPSSVAGGNGSSTLVVQTSAPQQSEENSRLPGKLGITALAGLVLFFLPWRMRRSRAGWPMLLVFLALSIAAAAGINACGGSSRLTGGTPVGAQSITVTGSATNGAQTETEQTTVTLNVQSLF